MSDYEDYGSDGNSDQFDTGKLFPDREFNNERTLDAHIPRPPGPAAPTLRSRPAINFSGRSSTFGTEYNYAGSTAARHTYSRMSGSTLRSGLDPSTAHLFSRNPPPTDLPPTLPPDVIASLTADELYYNPHHRRLHQKYEHVCDVLTTYFERGFTESRVAQSMSDTVVPNIYQAQAPCGAGSRTSSLGPSDSASQQQKIDFTIDKAIEKLLESVEPTSTRPRFLPVSVLWYYDDCKHDTSEGMIITENNKRRPRMNLAIRRPDGSKISSQEHANVRRSADIIVQELIKEINRDPRVDSHTSKSRTKTIIKNMFQVEFDSAVRKLEAEQKLLRLCAAHWKADVMIGQAISRYNDAETRALAQRKHATSSHHNPSGAKDLQLLEPFPASLIPQVGGAAPMNAAKRALDISPGPKSPSASHTQKRSKDETMVSRQKATGPLRPPNQSQHHAAHNITPTFLSRTKVTDAESAPTKLLPVYIDPSADNLIAILKSEFPSLTNGIHLLYSMNTQQSFKEGETSEDVMTLLERVQFADPGLPDIDEDNACQGWGHYQFTACGLSPASLLTTWQAIGSVAIAFKLVAAALKTCREARLMCANAGNPKATGLISDVYLEQTLDGLEKCWVGAGGIITSSRVPEIPTTPPATTNPSYRDVAMSPPRPPVRGPTIKFKWPKPTTDTTAMSTPEAPTGADSTNHQPAAGAEHTEAAASDKGARADAALLKTLQVSELLAWISLNELSAPKSKRKDDIIAAIVKFPEFAQVSKSTIEEIVEKRKQKKGPAL